MACPIHISFRNISLSEVVENACWREAAVLGDLPGVENCRLRIEGMPSFPGAGAKTPTASRDEAMRITLDFRIGGSVVQVCEHAVNHNATPGCMETLIAAVRAAVARGLTAARGGMANHRPSTDGRLRGAT